MVASPARITQSWAVLTEQRVIVVGAGLTGLAVAARLVSAGRDVLVLEASSRVGGQIHTHREGDLCVELGAEGFVARSRAVPALCGRVGLSGALVTQLTTDTYAVEEERLVLLAPGEAARRLGFQVPPEELGRGIASLALGMGQLTDALAAYIGPERLRLGARVSALCAAEAGLQVELSEAAPLTAGAVVLATPARVAAQLSSSLGLPETEPLLQAPLLSNVSVNLLYLRSQFANYPGGSGLIFPERFSEVGLRALSLVEHKFAGRVPDGHSLLRVFFRPVADALAVWSDERFVTEAASAVQAVLPVSGYPARAWVSRWQNALPIFSPDYKVKAASADQALQALRIHVAGSAFHGAGIDAAATSAEIVAARLGA